MIKLSDWRPPKVTTLKEALELGEFESRGGFIGEYHVSILA